MAAMVWLGSHTGAWAPAGETATTPALRVSATRRTLVRTVAAAERGSRTRRDDDIGMDVSVVYLSWGCRHRSTRSRQRCAGSRPGGRVRCGPVQVRDAPARNTRVAACSHDQPPVLYAGRATRLHGAALAQATPPQSIGTR